MLSFQGAIQLRIEVPKKITTATYLHSAAKIPRHPVVRFYLTLGPQPGSSLCVPFLVNSFYKTGRISQFSPDLGMVNQDLKRFQISFDTNRTTRKAFELVLQLLVKNAVFKWSLEIFGVDELMLARTESNSCPNRPQILLVEEP